MSHNITLSGLIISDLDRLAQAVSVVSNGSAKLVRKQTTFRTYSGQDPTCVHAIVIPGSKYDIGVIRSPGKNGEYTLVGDFSMLLESTNPFIARMQQVPRMTAYVGAGTTTAERVSAFEAYNQRLAQYAVGALLQEYALLSAEEQAAMLGRSTQRVPGKNGAIALEVTER